MNTNCCTTLLNGTTSIIPIPLCSFGCPQEYNCEYTYNSGCIIYNGPTLSCLNIPSGSNLNTLLEAVEILCENQNVPTQSCTVAISSNDHCCDYLVNKLVSNSGTIAFTTNNTTTPSGNCQTLSIDLGTVPCLGKVYVDSSDTTCDYLGNKIVSGAVYPMVMNPSGNATISFQKQFFSFQFSPGTVVNNVTCGEAQGTLPGGSVNTSWQNNSVNSPWTGPGSSPTYNAVAGTFTIVEAGTYDIFMQGQMSFSGTSPGLSGYVVLGITDGGSNVYVQDLSGPLCALQDVLIFNGFRKAFTFSANTTLSVVTYSTLTASGGVAHNFTPNVDDQISIGIEKVA